MTGFHLFKPAFRMAPLTLAAAFVCVGTFATGRTGVVENLSSHRLTGAVADLGAAELWGLPSGESAATLTGADGTVWPAEVLQGRLMGAVTLEPGGMAEMTAGLVPAGGPEVWVSEDGLSAEMTNGLLRWKVEPAAHGAPRWQLWLGGEAVPREEEIALQAMRYRGFVDSEPRGRLRRGEYVELGAVDIETMPIARLEVERTDEAATVRIFRTAPPAFPGLDFMEEYQLRSGLPVLSYRMRPANAGEKPVYLAYVFWEGDLHGRYGPGMIGNKLLAAPYPSEPYRLVTRGTPTEQTLTRWGRGWGAERAWVGMQVQETTGLGLGVTTPKPLTDRHYYGASIWVASPWQVHFDLTETERGFYPVELVPGGSRAELGLDLLITQGGVDPGPLARDWLHRAGKPDRKERLLSQGGATLPVVAMTSDGEILRPVPAMADVNRWAGARALRERASGLVASVSPLSAPRRLRAEVKAPSGGGALRFFAVSGQERTLIGEADAAGAHEWVLDPEEQAIFRSGWDLLIQVQGVAGPVAALIRDLSLSEPRPDAPALQSPLPDQSVTDIATFFRWEKVARAIAYELEYGMKTEPEQRRSERIESLVDLPFFMPKDLPASGSYEWRVRALLADGTPGPWSGRRSFTINDNHETSDLIRPISPSNPLFTMEAHGATSLVPFMDAIPADLRPYTAVLSWHTQYFHQIGKSLYDFFGEPAKHGEPLSLIVRFGHSGMSDVYVSLSELEAIFQEYPWVIGVIGTESFPAIHGSNPYVRRLIQLCGKYGRWFMEGDGNYAHNKLHQLASDPVAANLVREYAPYIVLSQKNNIHYLQYVNQSSLMGMKLSGMIGQLGSWEDGGWYWEQVGFRGLGERRGVRSGDIVQTPAVFWALTWIHGLSQGATVFHMDGQVPTVKAEGHINQQAADFDFKNMRHQVWTTEGQTLSAYHRVIAPIFRAIVKERLIPERDQILDSLRLAVRQDRPWEEECYADGAFYARYTPLYQETYGFEDGETSATFEYFPNTGRFGYFPILPLGSPPLKRAGGERIREVTMSELATREAVREAFHETYPENDYGDALVIRFPDRFFVQNTHENRDIAQRARIPVQAEGVDYVEATIEPHMYLIGRWERPDGGLWMQANSEYSDRPVRIAVYCSAEPTVEVTPAAALKRKGWRDGLLELELTTEDGAIDILLRTQPWDF